MSETWLNTNFPAELLAINGYNLVRWDRTWKEHGAQEAKLGGGLAIFIKQEYHVTMDKYNNFNISSKDMELKWIEINMENSKNIIIGIIYRPPQGNVNSCCETLVNNVNDITQEGNADVFLMGDFNINYFDKQSADYKCLHRFEMLTNLKQYIQKPTRKNHCIDLAYSNCDFVTNSGVLNILLSDHELIFVTRKKKKIQYNRVHFSGRSYRDYVKEELRLHLVGKDWNDYYEMTNPELCWDYIIKTVTEKIDVMCPLKTRLVRDKNEPWLTNEILEAIYDKDRAWKKAKKSKSHDDLVIAKRLRNDIKNMIRQAKANFVQDYLVDEGTSSRKFWEKLQYVTNSKSCSPKINLVDTSTGCPVENSDIPEFINSFFTNIGPNLAQNFKEDWNDNLPPIEHCFLDKFVFSEREIIEVVKEIDINKSSSLDNLSTRVLKDAFEYLTTQLTHMFNCSLNECTFPDAWKKATVVPLQKSGDKSNVNNLRPVSLLPLPGKLLEKLFHMKVSTFLDGNKLLNEGQNGFRKGRSTIGTVAELTDDILLGINDKNYTLAAFIDLRKAFDTVSHEILSKKMSKFGLHENIINWLKDYLRNRKQRCKVNGLTSEYQDITCGVPQGSILGPMLFLLYINDINNVLNLCKTKLYADDTVVYATNRSEAICHDWLCEDLQVLMNWLNRNKLTINLDKTKLMLFATKNMQKKANFSEVEIQGKNLQYVRQFNYLGVKLDNRVTFETHASECIRLVSHKLYLLTKIRK